MPIGFLLALFITLMPSTARAATFSGYLKTKHAKVIASCNLRAISDLGETREFTTGRSGEFSVDLGNGTWSILADLDQIQDWGFSQMDGVSITITGNMDVVRNLTLFASEPLRMPSLAFSRPDPKTWKFTVNGQGGTVVSIYSSTDLKTWTLYSSVAIGTTGQGISSSTTGNSYVPRIYFRAAASSE